MLKKNSIRVDNPELQDNYWPPVDTYNIDNISHAYITTELALKDYISENDSYEVRGEKINVALSNIYSYIYNYKDSPIYNETDSFLETNFLKKKVELEDHFLRNWLDVSLSSEFKDQESLAVYFEDDSTGNEGMNHYFFDYVAEEMSREAMIHFLKTEICRNEYVDDEVSLLVFGLQGQMKKVAASNLWDECGCGVLKNFHTYWLRQLIRDLSSYDEFLTWRSTKPWFFSLTSNIFNALLTKPSLKLAAYGCFTTTEQWVECHFEKIIRGMKRVGITSNDSLIYFDKHKTIDPHHTYELIESVRNQVPQLTSDEVEKIHYGAKLAIKTAVEAYDRMYEYYKGF